MIENTTQYTSPFGYRLSLPANWVVEEGETITSFYAREDGVGALQISTFEVPPEAQVDLVNELLDFINEKEQDELKPDPGYKAIVQKGVNIAMVDYATKGGRNYLEWFKFRRPQILFITYNCKLEHIGIEKEIAKEIVKSIEIFDFS